MFKFKGRTAVISGGAEGIGLSIAKALGEQKMNIVLADIEQLLPRSSGLLEAVRSSTDEVIGLDEAAF